MDANEAWKRYKHERLRAIWDSLEMWTGARYRNFVWKRKPGRLNAEWFGWFVGSWGVARTLKSNRRKLVLGYLDGAFRNAIVRNATANTVDSAATYIQKRGWSSRKRKDGQGSSVRSLVSKVGFFFCPDKIVPYDSFARRGLNVLRGSRNAGGEGYLHPKSYEQYLNAFNEKFLTFRPLLIAELRAPWVKALARQFGCSPRVFNTQRFQRKTFDNYLVQIGKTESGNNRGQTTV